MTYPVNGRKICKNDGLICKFRKVQTVKRSSLSNKVKYNNEIFEIARLKNLAILNLNTKELCAGKQVLIFVLGTLR